MKMDSIERITISTFRLLIHYQGVKVFHLTELNNLKGCGQFKVSLFTQQAPAAS